MKKTVSIILLLITAVTLFAFEWPQELSAEKENFSQFFGQSRNEAFINSLIFENPDTITAADDGTHLITIDAGLVDFGWFQSTLGNAVILEHSNNMMTVYGNLEEIYLNEDSETVSKGKELGVSGFSGWQKGKNCLEFQVIDCDRNTIINPFVLMSQTSFKRTMTITNPAVFNRQEQKTAVANGVRVQAGVYKLYIDRQKSGMTYQTSVSINGALVETITYDVLIQDNNKLCFTGKRNNVNYSYEDIYPDESRQLVAEVIFSKGVNTVSIDVSDIFGNTKTATYRVEVY
ncbi:MAG: M23 family metallopeptidase [Treponema sp.]|nr:M23 family metallopeptidase [Candidatus Treponema caballi]